MCNKNNYVSLNYIKKISFLLTNIIVKQQKVKKKKLLDFKICQFEKNDKSALCVRCFTVTYAGSTDEILHTKPHRLRRV